MANAILYYRTPTTRAIDAGFADPSNLPSAQKLEFLPPDDLTQGIDEAYQNNIVRKTPPKPGGRRLIQTDEGRGPWILTISGNFLNNTGDARIKINSFRTFPQSDSYHEFGRFGIMYPNGPPYLNIDPSATEGLMIEGTNGKHMGITKEIMDFAMILSHGGDKSP